jgi:DNA-binding transcriptional MerR regulator
VNTSVENISDETSRSPRKNNIRAIERFEPPWNAVYTIETTAQFVGLPRRTIAVCCKHGLVASAIHPANGYYFDQRAIHTLRRIESLRNVCGNDFPAIKIILDLMSQLERLQTKVRWSHEPSREVHRGKS